MGWLYVDSQQKTKKIECWKPPQLGTWKFSIDGASKGKPGQAGIGGVLRNHKGESYIIFNESVGIKDSNEAEILSIRRALLIWMHFGHENLIIEGDSANAFKWAFGLRRPPWRLTNVVREVRELANELGVSFVKIG